MIRRFAVLTFALLLLPAFAQGQGTTAMTAHEAQLYAAAKPEGQLVWYVAQFSTETADTVAKAFSARYPGLGVQVGRTTGQLAFSRLTQDIRTGIAQCDVFSATDVGHQVWLKDNGHLLRYVPENAAKLDPAYRDVDPDGYYHATSANPTVIIYNTRFLTEADAPKRWIDLADPKWRGKLALAHPGYSGSMGSWVVLMRKLYGWSFFERIEELSPHIGRSLIDPSTILNAGERWVGISSLATAVKSIRAGNPIGIVYPEDGAKLVLTSTSILANSPHPNAARLFLEYMLGVEFSTLLLNEGQPPLRPEAGPLPGARPISEIKVATISEEEVTAQVPEIIEKWRDTFDR
jgi:iron(III) transport system substrate-binding protein